MLHFTASHWPWEGPEDEHLSRQIGNPQHPDGGNLATYARMVESMDENVGRLMSALERLGIADNTIVVFTSDNGSERFSDTWPFIGAKTEILEGGMRGIGTKRTGRSGPSCTPPKSSGRWRATCFPDHLNCAMH